MCLTTKQVFLTLKEKKIIEKIFKESTSNFKQDIVSKAPEIFNRLIKEVELTANKDITVYKRLRAVKWKNQYKEGIIFTAPIRKMRYHLGYHYYQTNPKFVGSLLPRYKCKIRKDFTTPPEININKKISLSYIIDEGLHAHPNLDSAKKFKSYKEYIIECTIPKGSTYYLGTNNDIVTDNLILNKVIVEPLYKLI